MSVARRFTGQFARKYPLYSAKHGDPNISVLRLPPGDPLAVDMVAFIAEHMRPKKWVQNMVQFAVLVRKHRYLKYVRPSLWFAPLPAPQLGKTVVLRDESYEWFGWRVPSRREILRASYTVDLHGTLKHHADAYMDAFDGQ